jgi:hypothetical protein
MTDLERAGMQVLSYLREAVDLVHSEVDGVPPPVMLSDLAQRIAGMIQQEVHHRANYDRARAWEKWGEEMHARSECDALFESMMTAEGEEMRRYYDLRHKHALLRLKGLEEGA